MIIIYSYFYIQSVAGGAGGYPSCNGTERHAASLTHTNSLLHTWFPLEQVFCLDSSNLRHCGEDVGTVCRCTL